MTVSTTTRKISYTGTGANTVLSTVFPFFAAADLEVHQRITATGVVTVLILGVHYSVMPATDLPGVGSVTPINGAADFTAAMTWTIVRTTDITQSMDYVENDAFPAESHEGALDRLTLIAQEVAETAERSLAFPESDSTALDPTIPSSIERAEKLLYFDATGKPAAIEITDIVPNTVVFSALGQQIATIANSGALQALLNYVNTQGGVVLFSAGTFAFRPAAGDGAGFYFATDHQALYYSNGAAYTPRLDLTQVVAAASLPTTSGFIGIASDRRQLYIGNGASASLVRSFPPRYMAGFQMSRSAAREIDIGAGSCRNLLFTGGFTAADQANLISTSAMTGKDLAAAWSAGNDGGLLPAGVVLAVTTWYHVFAIGKEDGTVDFAVDTDVGGTNILADAAIKTAAGFTCGRRIGSIHTDGGSNILDFVQRGDTFLWKDPSALTLDGDFGSGDYLAGSTISLENVPSNVVVEAILNIAVAGGSGPGWLLSSGLTNSVTPSATASPLYNIDGHNPGAARHHHFTDGASPPLIRFRALTDNSMAIYVLAVGWVDSRGKDY